MSGNGSGGVWSVVRRALPLVVLLTAVGGAAGFGLHSVVEPTYTSTVDVLLVPLRGNPYSPDTRGENLANLASEVPLVTADAVAGKVAQRLGDEGLSAAGLSRRVTVTNPPNTQVLSIEFTAGSADLARRGAETFANTYLDSRRARAVNSATERLGVLDTAATATQKELLEALKDQTGTPAGSSDRAVATQRVQNVTDELTAIEAERSQVSVESRDPGSILSPASTPDAPAGLPNWLLLAAGLVVGALTGVALAWARQHLDDRLHTVPDVEAMGVRVLGVVRPSLGTAESHEVLKSQQIVLPDDIRLLRTGLAATAGHDEQGQVLCLTEVPDGYGGATATWLALTAALARADNAVTLIDTNQGHTSLWVGEHLAPGLSDVLQNRAALTDVVRGLQPRLGFVTTGSAPDVTSERLLSPRLAEILGQFRSTSRWTLLLAPPTSRPEASALAMVAGRVLLGVDLHSTTRTALRRSLRTLERSGASVVEVVAHEPGSSRESRRRGEKAGSRPPKHPPQKALPVAAYPASPTSSAAVGWPGKGTLPPATAPIPVAGREGRNGHPQGTP